MQLKDLSPPGKTFVLPPNLLPTSHPSFYQSEQERWGDPCRFCVLSPRFTALVSPTAFSEVKLSQSCPFARCEKAEHHTLKSIRQILLRFLQANWGTFQWPGSARAGQEFPTKHQLPLWAMLDMPGGKWGGKWESASPEVKKKKPKSTCNNVDIRKEP